MIEGEVPRPRDELISIQRAKLAALAPFSYENSGFYRRRLDEPGLLPMDIQTLEHLKWPVIDKAEMIAPMIAPLRLPFLHRRRPPASARLPLA